MRRYCLILLLPLLAACKVEEAPEPEPRQEANPVVIKAETDRQDLMSGNPGSGDFKINFSEPFIGFEIRGSRLGISNPGSSPSYEVVDTARTSEGGATVLRGTSDLVFGGEAFVLTIEKRECTNRLTGEKTRYLAWLGPASAPRKLSTCAARAR